MLYYAVGSRGPGRRPDVHRLAQPQGLHRRQAGQAGLDRPVGRLGHRRAARDRGRGRARPAGVDEPGTRERADVAHEFRQAALSWIDPVGAAPDEGGARRRQRHGRRDGRPAARPTCRWTRCATYWEPDGEFPGHEPNPLLRGEPPVHRRQGARVGRRAGHRLGRRRRPLLLHRRHAARFVDGDFLCALLAESILEKEPGAAILYDVRASRAVRRPGGGRRRHRPREPGGPRLLQDPHARRGRGLRRRGLRPLLLPRLLQRRLGHAARAADPRAAVEDRQADERAARAAALESTSSRARSTPRSQTRRPR